MPRVDLLLVEQQVFESRKKAQVAIEKGIVFRRRKDQSLQKINRSSEIVVWEEGDEWLVLEDLELKYVSRAGAKLHAALHNWKIDVVDKVVLDVGLSTGGFSDCLLQQGARLCVGIDVGQAQLHSRLKDEPRLISLEKWNAKNSLPDQLLAQWSGLMGQTFFDFIVVDVSFISVLSVFVVQSRLLTKGGGALLLFKPQFEVGAEHLGKKGIADETEGLRVLQKTVTTLESQGFSVQGTFASPVKGEDGNQEYFIYLQKLSSYHP